MVWVDFKYKPNRLHRPCAVMQLRTEFPFFVPYGLNSVQTRIGRL